jgi:hypothetical protein
MKIRVNADDFGLSLGVNCAIEEMFQKQQLHSASLIFGCGYFDQALEIAKKNPDLKIGLHFNLSVGKSAFNHAQPSLLVDKNSNFKNGFLQLLILSIFKKKQLRQEVACELEAQIQATKDSRAILHHINSHRHVHFIPLIFLEVLVAAKNHQINKVRVINESLFSTWKMNCSRSFLFNGGIFKWLILRFLGLFNNSKKNASDYFFSILYTCQISDELIAKIKVPKNFSESEVEIMIHPGNPTLDATFQNLFEANHLLSNNRLLEKISSF